MGGESIDVVGMAAVCGRVRDSGDDVRGSQRCPNVSWGWEEGGVEEAAGVVVAERGIGGGM